jgi:TetR/AcrR family transcriptional regulator, cholesterol catabolism regulator
MITQKTEPSFGSILSAMATRPRPAPPARPALRARFDRRRRTLVDDAARVFAKRGYDQTSMQDLAASLGMATGALYHYFPGKEDLLAAICEEIIRPLLAEVAELDAAATPDERLRALVRAWVAHVCVHRDHMLVFGQERHQIEAGVRWRAARADRKRFDRQLAEALADAGLGGATTPRGQLARLALLGMVNHLPQWYRPRGPLSPEQIADGFLELLVGGGGEARAGS